MSYRAARDQRIADDVGSDRELMCCASGCPSRWSVDGPNGRACSAHAWVNDRHEWPAITDRQIWSETERARQAMSSEERIYPRMSHGQKTALLRKLAAVFAPKPPKAWAEKLRDKEQQGEPLSRLQQQAWREALRESKRFELSEPA